MSEELRRRLEILQEDYVGQPHAVQQADLRTINQIRAQLGMPLVDAQLHEIGGSAQPLAQPEPDPEPEEATPPDHAEARKLYRTYLKKMEELKVHRAYAERVARATSGHGQTPVRPLATMGTNGGPLLCDHCQKPILLEGGAYHGQTADVAWAASNRQDWNSWILGGMVVEIHTNGTLRIYHGYPGRNPRDCCNAASRKPKEKADPETRAAMEPLFAAFVAQEFAHLSDTERQDLVHQVLTSLYGSDPGLGVNRPS